MKDFISQLSVLTKTLVLFGLICILYSYICRFIGFYFFWESESIGWSLLFCGIISFLFDRINLKQSKREKVVLERIGVGIAGFLLVIQAVLFVSFYNSEAYLVAKDSLLTNKTLTSEIGEITGFSLNSNGEINLRTDSAGEHGDAVIQMIAKGDKRFKDVTVYVVKHTKKRVWEVEGIE
jgi:hypothetical protein